MVRRTSRDAERPRHLIPGRHCTAAGLFPPAPRVKSPGNDSGAPSADAPPEGRALRIAQARLRAIVESLPFDFWACDREGRYVMQNATAIAHWGDHVGLRPEQTAVPPDILELWLRNNARALAGEIVRGEVSYSHPEGVGHYLNILAPIRDEHGIHGMLGVNIDITDRKRAEAQLRQSEERFRLLVEGIRDYAIFMLDPEGHVTGWNAGAERLTGHSGNSILGKHFSIFYRRRDAEQGRPQLELKGAELEGAWQDEGWRVRRDGTAFRASVTLTALRDPADALVGFAGIFRDLTEIERADEQMRESQGRLATIFEGALDAIVTADADESILLFNPAAQQMFGYSAEEAAGLPLERIIRPAAVTAGPQAPGAAALVGTRADGSDFSIEGAVNRPSRTDGETAYVLILRDITERDRARLEREQMEQRLRESQRLESLGVLAGGIAHDFNNLLTAILGNASLAATLLPGDPERVSDSLHQIELSASRAAELCQQMLDYSGSSRTMPRPVDLSRLVGDQFPVLRASVPRRISLHTSLAAHLPRVLADPEQLRQVLEGLVLNAAEAIGEKDGSILISTGSLTAGAGYLAGTILPSTPPGEFAWLQVTDNGSGIPSDNLARIFDPFFSSRFAGRGLGLAAAVGIARGHGGSIRVDSVEGKGSKFRVLLPADPGETEEDSHEPAGSSILIIDDEPAVCMITSRLLQKQGYAAETATEGDEAIERFRSDPGAYSLVMVDLTMPFPDGEVIARTLREIRPDIKVLVMSGFAEDTVRSRFSPGEIAGFLQKPFNAAALAEKVRSVLA